MREQIIEILTEICPGVDFEQETSLIDAYRNLNMDDYFFRPFFEKLIGNGNIRKMIEAGKSAEEIKASWADDVAKFKQQRRKYLLYQE